MSTDKCKITRKNKQTKKCDLTKLPLLQSLFALSFPLSLPAIPKINYKGAIENPIENIKSKPCPALPMKRKYKLIGIVVQSKIDRFCSNIIKKALLIPQLCDL